MFDFVRSLFGGDGDGAERGSGSGGVLELSVSTEVLYNKDDGEYIVGYGYKEDYIWNVGVGESLSEAFLELSREVDKASWRPMREVREVRSKGEEAEFCMDVYFIEGNGLYVVVVRGEEEVVVRGKGRDIPRAFVSVGERLGDS